MDREELKIYIKEKIKNNQSGDITGDVLQDVLLKLNDKNDIKAIATPGRDPDMDCNVLYVLAKAMQDGTIFDVMIVYTPQNSEESTQAKVLSTHGTYLIGFYDSGNDENVAIDFYYSPDQYAALSAVQLEMDRINGAIINSTPVFKGVSGFLEEDECGAMICNQDGYKYAVTINDNRIATISVSNELDEEDHIVIDETTAQNLIGLYIEGEL